MFLFLITFTIRQQCIIYPLEFPTVPTSFRISLFGGGGHSGFLGFVEVVGGVEAEFSTNVGALGVDV